MPKPPDHLGISQEAFERLLLQEQWLAEFLCTSMRALPQRTGARVAGPVPGALRRHTANLRAGLPLTCSAIAFHSERNAPSLAS